MNIIENIQTVFPYAPIADLTKTFEIFNIQDTNEIACFVAQIGHESAGFKATTENLNYSAKALANTFPTRFRNPNTGMPNSQAFAIERNPQAIANAVYNGRMGNRPDSNDGWTYRGRGFIQITGRENYFKIGENLTAHGLLSSPEEVLQNPSIFATSPFASFSAGAFWEANNLKIYCEDFRLLTKKINGGLNGFADRLKNYNRLLGRY